MRMMGPMLAASLATLAAVSFSGAAAAQAAAAAPPAAAAPATLGTKFVAIDGYKYGGRLPVNTDKNLDAVRLLIKAADATGNLRGSVGPYLVLGETTAALRINAEGKWNGKPAHVVFDFTDRVPGVRLDVTYQGGAREITVVAKDKAWDEKTPGVFGGAAKTSVAERLILMYLTPTGVIVKGRDAADVIKASKDSRAKDVLTIPLPIIGAGVNLVATLDSAGFPVRTSITYNGHTYTGEFDDFLTDRGENLVYSPHLIKFAMDGMVFADLEVNWHQTNPYLIFPVPSQVASK